MHECVHRPGASPRTASRLRDVAKRLLDFGFHAPTIYFPLRGAGRDDDRADREREPRDASTFVRRRWSASWRRASEGPRAAEDRAAHARAATRRDRAARRASWRQASAEPVAASPAPVAAALSVVASVVEHRPPVIETAPVAEPRPRSRKRVGRRQCRAGGGERTGRGRRAGCCAAGRDEERPRSRPPDRSRVGPDDRGRCSRSSWRQPPRRPSPRARGSAHPEAADPDSRSSYRRRRGPASRVSRSEQSDPQPVLDRALRPRGPWPTPAGRLRLEDEPVLALRVRRALRRGCRRTRPV